jgi:arylsulfatase
VPDEYYSLFKDIDPSSGFENDKRPLNPMNENDKENARKVYAMVKNIDDNIGRILQELDELNLAENTVVIFMTDNGPQQSRYNAGMRGLKSSVYRGGVRVPFFMRYPRLSTSITNINTTAANIDILPTLAELCDARVPSDREIDGKSLVPVIRGNDVDWKDRPLFFYWTRTYPELYNNVALQKGKYKLVGHTDYDSGIPGFELYDIEKDPYEQTNIIRDNISMAESLKEEFDTYYEELINSPSLTDPQRIIIGNINENPVCLNRNDAGGDRGIWTQEEIFGKWRVSILEGMYNIRCHFLNQLPNGGQMVIETGTIINQKRNTQEGLAILEMNKIKYPGMDCDFIPFYQIGSKRIMPLWVEVERIK